MSVRSERGHTGTCKRCGGPNHGRGSCPFPSVRPRRPDIERLVSRLERGECKSIGAAKLLAIVEYLYEIEAQRRALIGTVRDGMGAPLPQRLYKTDQGKWRR